jgi:outer membrane lipoprotein SlyB
MKYFEKIALMENKTRDEIRKTFRNAERALVKSQRGEIKTHSIIGAGLGGGAGAVIAKGKPIKGALVGTGLGFFAGAVSGAMKGSRGRKTDEIRKKYFGTDDLNKIRKLQKENFGGLKDYYKKEK